MHAVFSLDVEEGREFGKDNNRLGYYYLQKTMIKRRSSSKSEGAQQLWKLYRKKKMKRMRCGDEKFSQVIRNEEDDEGNIKSINQSNKQTHSFIRKQVGKCWH